MAFASSSKVAASEIIISGQAILQLGQDFANIFKQVPYVGGIAALLDDILTVGQEMQSTNAFTEEMLAHVVALSSDISCYLKEMSEYDTTVDQTRGLVHELEEYQKFLHVTVHELKDSLNAGKWHKFLGRKGGTVQAWRRTLDNYQMRFQNRILLNILTLLVPNSNRNAPKQTSEFRSQIPKTVTDQEKKLREAVSQSDDILRRACALQRLGIFYIQNDRIKDAQEAVRCSLELCEKKEITNQVPDERDGDLASTQLAVASKSGSEEIISPKNRLVLDTGDEFTSAMFLSQQPKDVPSQISQKNQPVLDTADASTSALTPPQQRNDVPSQISPNNQSVLDTADAFTSALTLSQQGKDVPSQISQKNPSQSEVDTADAIKSALSLSQQRNDVPSQILNYRKLASVCVKRGRIHDAGEALKAAVDLPQDAQSAAGLHQDLGQLYFNSGELDYAEVSFKEALTLFTRCDSCHGQATNYFKLGRLYWCKKQLEDAEWAFQIALGLRRQEQNVSGQAYNHQMLGQVYADQRRFEDAEKEFKAGLQFHREGSPIVVIAGNHQELGQLYMTWGRLENAVEELREARKLYGSCKHLQGEAKSCYKLGQVYWVLGRWKEAGEAREAFQNAFLRLCQSEKDTAGEARNYQELGEINLRQGRLKKAKISFEKALSLHRQNKDLAAQTDIHMKLGDVHSQLGRRGRKR